MDMNSVALTPASGTSVIRRRRSVSPERVREALADMDHVMSAFEIGTPEPAATPAPARTHVLEPSWAPTPSMN